MPFLASQPCSGSQFSHLSLLVSGKVATRRLKSLNRPGGAHPELEMVFTTNTLSLVVNAQESGGTVFKARSDATHKMSILIGLRPALGLGLLGVRPLERN